MNARREVRAHAQAYGYRRMTIDPVDHYFIGPVGRSMAVSVLYTSTGNISEARVYRGTDDLTSILPNERDKRHKVLELLRRWKDYA